METTMFNDTLRNPWLWLLAAAIVVFAVRADARTIADATTPATPCCVASGSYRI